MRVVYVHVKYTQDILAVNTKWNILSRNGGKGPLMTSPLIERVGQRIKEFRTAYGERGISQEALATKMGVATNTISRWETATVRPSIEDLEKLARFFGKSIEEFFPRSEVGSRQGQKMEALLRAAGNLDDKELDEVRKFAEYRRARMIYEAKSPGRRRS
jgi:putative transcriptional regulator